MSNLSTLIEDIYDPLNKLSEGKPLPLTEEDIDLALSNIKNSIISWATPSERNAKFTLRMSNIGRPARQLWFQKRDEYRSSGVNGATQIKFLYGHILEEILLMLVRMSGHKVTDEQKEVEVLGITGHIDCKIDGEVIDVKTASKFAFNKFANGTLAQDDGFGYLGQLGGYEAAEKTDNGGFLVINKESGELCLYQPDDMEKPNIENKIQTLLDTIDLDTKPDLCYTPIPEGKKGNMKLPKPCSWCSYKFDCHSSANDGAGLRVFKYSNGYTYFTHVEAEPTVEEVL